MLCLSEFVADHNWYLESCNLQPLEPKKINDCLRSFGTANETVLDNNKVMYYTTYTLLAISRGRRCKTFALSIFTSYIYMEMWIEKI